MKKKLITILLFIFLFIVMINAEPALITPDEFEYLGNTSVDVMRAFYRGLQIITEFDPLFFLDADTIQAFSEDFAVPDHWDTKKVLPIQGDVTFYWRPFQENNWSLSLFASTSTIDLQIKEETMSSTVYGWMIRYMILGIRTSISDFLKLTIGYLRKSSPIILKDIYGRKYFSDKRDEKGDIKHDIADSGFFHTDIFGVDLGAVLKAGTGIDFVKFKIPFEFNNGNGKIKPDFAYYRFHDIVKTGVLISNEFPVKIEGTKIEAMIVEVEGYARVYARDDWIGPTIGIINLTTIAGKEKITSKSIKNLESYALLKIGVSYSKELYSAGVAGAIIELGYENFCIFENHFISANLGVAYNYHYSLCRMPIRNFVLIPVTLRWMF